MELDMAKEFYKNPENLKDIKILVDFLSMHKDDNDLPNADVIFVFGHYDPRPALQAAKLWKMGKAPIIILSGKGRDKIPSGFESEADFYASLIEKEAVPQSVLLLEKESTNTIENCEIWYASSPREKYSFKINHYLYGATATLSIGSDFQETVPGHKNLSKCFFITHRRTPHHVTAQSYCWRI